MLRKLSFDTQNKINKRLLLRNVSKADMLNTVRDTSEGCQLIIFVHRSVCVSGSAAAGYNQALCHGFEVEFG